MKHAPWILTIVIILAAIAAGFAFGALIAAYMQGVI
jgi:hypothetical protein